MTKTEKKKWTTPTLEVADMDEATQNPRPFWSTIGGGLQGQLACEAEQMRVMGQSQEMMEAAAAALNCEITMTVGS